MPDTDTTEATAVVDTEVDTEPADAEDADVGESVPTETEDSEQGEGDAFPRSYVEELRRENARYRERARNADTYAKRLHTELVRATGKLADPTDLEFAEGHLDDSDALTAAIDALLAKKPHLASRRPTGEIGQGATPSTATVDLAAILRRRAQ